MKIILTESQLLRLVQEQDEWTRRAASGPQKCGKDAKFCKDGENIGRSERIRGEKPMSAKQSKKYSENEYWDNQLLKDISTNSELSSRADSIKGQVESISGKFSTDDKAKIIVNLTNRLNKETIWWFSSFVKKALKLEPSTTLTDKNVIDFVKMKGGFDEFKKYYLESVF